MEVTYPIYANTNDMIGAIFAIAQNLLPSTEKYLDESSVLQKEKEMK